MNKARAMLDALMGPGRDVLDKDKNAANEKFKDKSVCKGYLIGMCPLDPSLLGGKRSYPMCEKIHSEPMRDQLQKHKDCESLTREYERLSLQDLELAVRECEGHIAEEKSRIRTDIRRKKPPLPLAVNDRLSKMKRESSQMIQKAEEMDDDQIREKEALVTKANELLKEREEYLEAEMKKAIEALDPEEVCEICGTAYVGKDGDAAHLKFRIHDAFKTIRDRIAEVKPRVEAWEKKRQEERDAELKKKRKEEWDKAQEKEGGGKGEKPEADEKDRKESRPRSEQKEGSRGKSRGKSKGKSRDRSRGKSRGKSRDKSRGKSRGKSRRADDGSREPSKSRAKSSAKDKSRSRSGKRRRGSDRDRSRSGGRRGRDRDRDRKDSRSRSKKRRRR
mmetsp:Transcript_34174/g.98540  ORF Transcript_34174/g.98540 Transcript_34174/m.98540 type:complete len:390 (-) Transcript_34174:38-1207(-)